MALKTIVDSLDGIPEVLHEHYKEMDGRFVLQAEAVDGYALENIVGLKETNRTLRKEVDELRKVKAAVGDLDIEAAREAMAKVDQMKDWTPDDKHRDAMASLEKRLSEKYGKDIQAKETAYTDLLREHENILVSKAATDAIREHRGNVDILLPHVLKAVQMVRDDSGRWGAKVLDETGHPRLSPKPGSTAEMTIGEYVEQMRGDAKWQILFEGTGRTGAGAASPGRPAPAASEDLSKLSPAERLERGRQLDAAKQRA